MVSKKMLLSPLGGIGRHKGLKIPRLKSRAGSSPAAGTTRPEVITTEFAQFLHICVKYIKVSWFNKAQRYGK